VVSVPYPVTSPRPLRAPRSLIEKRPLLLCRSPSRLLGTHHAERLEVAVLLVAHSLSGREFWRRGYGA